MGKLQVVVGGQAGSEGKGATAAWLVQREHAAGRRVHCCRVGGPNAGHTAHDAKGREFKLQQVPIGAIWDAEVLSVAAGSVVDRDILDREVHEVEQAGHPVLSRLFVDPMATRLDPVHAQIETLGRPHGEAGLTRRIGSTGKGVGAAREDRIGRRAHVMREHGWKRDVSQLIADDLRDGTTIQIEGTQGYALGLHTSYYPYTTSTDCRAIDFMAQAGVSPWQRDVDVEIWVVFRTFPIRVAGNSGPLLGETTWEALGVQPELTTVTKKQRRVGTWDAGLARQAVYANGGPGSPIRVALLFLDYAFPSLAGCTDFRQIWKTAGVYLAERGRELGQPISAVGVGPSQIVSLED